MTGDDCSKYVETLIPNTFNDIYVIDMMGDLVNEYFYVDGVFKCNSTVAFTSFYNDLLNSIHPDDIKGYIDSISTNNLKTKKEEGIDVIKFQYRKKNASGQYDWYLNITKLFVVNQKNLVLVLDTNIDSINEDNEGMVVKKEKLEDRQKIIFDAVSNSIIKLNGVMNINRNSQDPEIKSITKYVDNILLDLTNSFPELQEALTNNMIDSITQGATKTIIIVDDDSLTRTLLSKTFQDTYKVLFASNGQEAIDILERNNAIKASETKDKIIGMFLDLNMPVVDGFGVLDYMSSQNLLTKMPVIIISGDYDQNMKERAYSYPIADVLEKPFNLQIIKHRIRNLIKLYKSNNALNEIVLNQHEDIKNVLRTLVKSYLNDYSNDIRRIKGYVDILARQVVNDYDEYHFEESHFAKIVDAVAYYDIGLYTLPHKLLAKKDLTEEEEKIIDSNPFVGLSIFNSVLYRETDRIFNHYAKDIIEYYHEHYDGSGYPHGISEDRIPLAVQIVSVAIAYNNFIKTMTGEETVQEIVKRAGKEFNPKIVESLKKVSAKFTEVK